MTIVQRDVPYRDEGTALHGVLILDDTTTERRPGILLVHGGGGLDQHAISQARRYAGLGYVVFACDMFGEGVADDRERIMTTLRALRDDPDRLTQRATSGLAVLAQCGEADSRHAVIGFCFGGLTTLTLARSGAELAGAIGVHGSLATPRPAVQGAIRASVLACHGAADPHVPMQDVIAFTEEMDRAKADWQLILYGGAVHGFTHDHAVPGAIPGVAYDAKADQRSFIAIRSFLDEVFTRIEA